MRCAAAAPSVLWLAVSVPRLSSGSALPCRAASGTGAPNVTSVTNGTCFAAGGGGLFGRVVAFGDSLSDMGNLFRLTNGSRPRPDVYWRGRMSNGPVWVEWFRQALGAPCIRDYAFIGSSSDTQLIQGYAEAGPGRRLPVPGARQQIEQYLREDEGGAARKEKEEEEAEEKGTLVSVWTGSNNFLGPLVDKSVWKAISAVRSGPTTIVEGIRLLSDGGGGGDGDGTVGGARRPRRRTRNLLVLNLPPIDRTPAARRVANEAGPLARWLARAVFPRVLRQLNRDLRTGLESVAAAARRPLRIALFDVHGVTADTIDNRRGGFKNFDDACVKFSPAPETGEAGGEAEKAANVCADPNSHFFYDDVHPSARAHRILGAAVAAFARACFTANLTRTAFKPANASWADSACYGRLA
ncbi:MAG: hypothetical protein BJ554DRAFT_4878 [Olpidium bornovanus]|uniref:GDSL esterase/lipase n=1 Tax=Olpidium bornovanus TaxID=278681 RepID=A0A8H7ZKV8_9FUNG|nr:MAG: hypothetical protein BJ554DRAFT_4878 [Olpidium bornovanus]